jgi:hypothetical protein
MLLRPPLSAFILFMRDHEDFYPEAELRLRSLALKGLWTLLSDSEREVYFNLSKSLKEENRNRSPSPKRNRATSPRSRTKH